jgi:hypothetical protein
MLLHVVLEPVFTPFCRLHRISSHSELNKEPWYRSVEQLVCEKVALHQLERQREREREEERKERAT